MKTWSVLLLVTISGPGRAGEKADPAATKLLAEARAARAEWKNFPGFSAGLAVNVNGQVVKGRVEISAAGKVKLEGLDKETHGWVRAEIASLVGHRLPNASTRDTPCAFADDNRDHPSGRLIKVLNDELHSSYRIRDDRQIIEVNRQTGPVRFTITVLENRRNKEKQYLPISYVVNTWEGKTGALKSSRAHHHTWQRVGAFDLPATVLTLTASAGTLEARQITFANPKLHPPTEK